MSLLYPTNYKKPGTYNKLSGLTNESKSFRMLPVVLGKGSKFIKKTQTITRGFVYQEKVSVSALFPNIFTTKYPFIKDNKKVFVYSDTSKLSNNLWKFVDEHTIQLLEYNPEATYYVDYQSTSQEVEDKLDLDVFKIESTGYSPQSLDYLENVDFHLNYSLNDVKINGEKEDSVISFNSAYYSTLNYSHLEDYIGIDSLEVRVDKYTGDATLFECKVSRVEYNEAFLSYIWLDIKYDNTSSTIKVYNDGNYYEYNGIEFKIVGDTFHSHLVTRNNTFLRSDEYEDIITFKVIPKKELIEGPERKITINVIHKGNIDYEEHISNVESKTPDYLIKTSGNNIEVNLNFVLSISGVIFKESSYYVVFELKDNNSSIIKEVPASLVDEFIYLNNDVELETGYGIKVTLYKDTVKKFFMNDKGVFIVDENFVPLIADEGGVPIKYEFSDYVLKFDYSCINKSEPTEVRITNSCSTKNEKIVISDSSYYSFDGVIAKLNMDIIEESDIIQFSVVRGDSVNWNLTTAKEEVFRDFLIDYSGTLNGKFASKYIVLKGSPIIDSIEVISKDTFDYEVITKNGITYLVFTNKGIPYEPNSEVTIRYNSFANKPKVGSTYYIAATCIREDSLYNNLIEVHSLEEGRDLLGPYESGNSLYIANEVAWRELSSSNTYGYVQIKDSDDDGILSREDIEKALRCLETSKKATDIVLLDNFEHIDLLVDFNASQNEPMTSNENKLWIGFPSNYSKEEIINFHDSISSKEYSDFRIMLANNSAFITIDSIPITTKVDGSMIAWSLACVRRSEETPYADSLINKRIRSFDSILTFDDKDCEDFGSSNIIYLDKIPNQQSYDYIIYEDCTVSGNTEQIVDQNIYVCRYVRDNLKEVVGLTFPTPQEALTTIKSKLLLCLKQLISTGVISKYLKDDGTSRDIDPSVDVFVSVVKNNPTQYLFGYGFYTKKGIKHLFGTYVIDSTFN